MFNILDNHLHNYIVFQNSYFRTIKFAINNHQFEIDLQRNSNYIDMTTQYVSAQSYRQIDVSMQKKLFKKEFGNLIELYKWLVNKKINFLPIIKVYYDPLDYFKTHIGVLCKVNESLEILYLPYENRYSFLLKNFDLSTLEYNAITTKAIHNFIPENYEYSHCDFKHITYLIDMYIDLSLLLMKKYFQNGEIFNKLHSFNYMLKTYKQEYNLSNKYYEILKLILYERKGTVSLFKYYKDFYKTTNPSNVGIDMIDEVCNVRLYNLMFYGLSNMIYNKDF